MKIFKKYPLKPLNTFGVEVFADYLVEIRQLEELFEIISKQELLNLKQLVLGGGSNVLFTKDFNGLILKNYLKGIEIIEEKGTKVKIKAQSGELWHDLVMFAVENEFYGIENLALIPGTVGAAPVQNIGAYGVELKDVFIECEAIDLSNGELKVFSKSACNFGYRESIFKSELKGRYFISAVTIELDKRHQLNMHYSDISNITSKLKPSELTLKRLAEIVIEIRQKKLPDPEILGNAGSFFKNPVISNEQFIVLKSKYPVIKSNPLGNNQHKIAAAWLIEQAGFKGKRIGDVGTHQNQPLVIVNYGKANGLEVLHFANLIKQAVKKNFDIRLDFEVNII
jgi:UDP-N-acetylmuramate dehydrogenase